jgi:two-component system chemotaxis response regulator CheB
VAKIRLMIVDDSATLRQVLSAVLAQVPDIEVLATASDPIFALEKMKKDWPDVLLLDIEMPRMDGLTFLRQLMKERPVPVVIFSTLTERGTAVAMQALAAGAVGVAAKPASGLKQFLQQHSDGLIQQIRAAAAVRLTKTTPVQSKTTCLPVIPVAAAPVKAAGAGLTVTKRPALIAIGSSTGGPQAIEALLTPLPATMPGMVIVQHMPQNFTGAFARRLNTVCQLEVKEAEPGDQILPGRVLIAPGGQHMKVRQLNRQLIVDVQSGPHVNRHCPSVDVLFKSVAQVVGDSALGMILTGMGNDGARGMKEMFDRGALTFAEDEQSCIVYGMPKEAVKMGGVSQSMSLSAMVSMLLRYSENHSQHKA